MEMIGGSGVEGFSFYWLFWMFWTMSTFFMRKSARRWKLSMWLLVAIILSLNSVKLFHIEISMTCLFMLFTAYMMIAKEKKKVMCFIIISSFIVMLAYVSFHLFELVDPVWLMIDRKWMLSILLTYLVVILHNGFYQRMVALLCGMVHGDVVYSLVILKYSLRYEIGTLSFLDVVAISTVFILILEGIKKVSAFFDQHFNQLTREKQKQS